MPDIAVTVNGRSYRVACAEGEENRVSALAQGIDRRVAGLVRGSGQVGEGQLLVVAGLMMADEMEDMRAELERLRSAPPPPAPLPVVINSLSEEAEAELEASMIAAAERIEAVAAALERP